MSTFLILNTQIVNLHKFPFSIGRALDNHLVIQESSVSRHHAEIILKDNQYTLRDLQSTGGTLINGKRITEAALNSGDSIVLASTPLIFVDNAPQLSERAEDPTGPLRHKEKDNEPTILEVKPDWRPKGEED